MSQTIFNQINFSLENLIGQIELGQIGLPDIQRPFVWSNAKVRDLFDSMYKGYPVGYLLFWQNGQSDGHRPIGADGKQLQPDLVIVDGQQRLTSLYAVLNGAPIVKSDYSKQRIRIAFNPLEKVFEVPSAATNRDRAFIPDISVLWDKDANLFEIANDYLDGLRSVREVTAAETQAIQKNLMRLQQLSGFPFTALILSAGISESDVADVFVRINSQGASLNQADFILTLMSVFWDTGRSDLERFYRDSRTPNLNGPSSFNHFIEPAPAQMLRVGIGLGFKRARLEHVYSILRGKDLETGQFDEGRRQDQFARLEDAQAHALKLSNWHDFLLCIRQAGYRSRSMISSNNSLLFSYAMYLIGRIDHGVELTRLRALIAQWFFMAALTRRYTNSPESALEADLAMLRGVGTADEFVTKLRQASSIALPPDYWEVGLPNDLATSAARSPSRFAYEASQVLLGSPALFSKFQVAELLDPSLSSTRNAVERHHLFPRKHLEELGIDQLRDINQIANYAFVEWPDNAKISDQAPSDYLPDLESRFGVSDLAEMRRLNALPLGWEALEYAEFLERRRVLMARLIRESYQQLESGVSSKPDTKTIPIPDVIEGGESEAVEFKSTLRTNLHTGQKDARMELAIIRTLAGFLNGFGGTLVVGVSDDGMPIGLDRDGFASEDRMNLHLVNLINGRIGASAWHAIRMNFEDFAGNRVLVVHCNKSAKPVYVKDGQHQRFFLRTGAATTELPVQQAVDYIGRRFG